MKYFLGVLRAPHTLEKSNYRLYIPAREILEEIGDLFCIKCQANCLLFRIGYGMIQLFVWRVPARRRGPRGCFYKVTLRKLYALLLKLEVTPLTWLK